MNKRHDQSMPNADASCGMNIHVQGQLFSRDVLEAVVRDVLVPALTKQLLADAAVQQALSSLGGAQHSPVERKQGRNANLLDVNEAAERLGIRPATVRQWIYTRKIPVVRVGRCVRVPAEAITRLIESNTMPAIR